MKVKINLFLGMLGSGKTTLINSFLNDDKYIKEKIVVIQEEDGKSDIDIAEYRSVIVLKNKSENKISVKVIKEIIKDYSPDRILIECNGMSNPENLINDIKSSYLKRNCVLDNIFMTIDCKTANMYLLNMGDLIRIPIFYSDVILLNNTENMNKKSISLIKSDITQTNELSQIILLDSELKINKLIKERKISLEKSKGIVCNLYNLLIVILSILLIYIVNKIVLLKFDNVNEIISQIINIFTGIILEGIPFIFLGSLISAFIELFISEDTIIKIFSRNKIISTIVAVVLGFFIPICDCATIPLARALMKKNIPISTVVTFILAAPIVNPIAIMSTIYAFPNMNEIVYFRVAIGIFVAITVGLICGNNANRDIVIASNTTCNCGMCNIGTYNDKNILLKLKRLLISASDEFFYVGKYMIFGALFAAITQSLINKGTILNIPINQYSSVVIMMIFAFVFSVCSTSDAFVAKSFIGNFSEVSIIGFLVLGPMIDIKNTIMLFSNFKKSFVSKLIISVLVTTTIALTLLILLGGVI